MIIQPTSLAALAWAGAASGSAAESWRIGTVLSARPLGINPDGMMVLQIGAVTVEMEAPAGQQLPAQFQVRVLTLGAQPQLEFVMPQTVAEPATQLAMRERLPQQNGYAPLLATLDALAQRPALRQLPAYLRPALALLEHGVRTPAEITRGEGLEEAIKRSGLFLESQLAQPNLDMAGLSQEDWKAALLRLASLLDDYLPARRAPSSSSETPPPLQQRGLQAQPRALLPTSLLDDDVDALLARLHGEVHAALARVEVAQLEATTTSAWMIEIPLQGEEGRDILQVQMQRHGDAQSGSAWTFGFAIDLPSLGAIQGELQLRDLRLSVRLWAERIETVHRLEQQFGALRQALSAAGLILDQLSCQQGLPQSNHPHSAILLRTTA
ncbi:flagellar hook-length control protein FliK [Dyella sp. C11]|uniref:flagellar hook-length control protein FliK n=1 Tax=Dyella sp. C11 TaxID=2126991 RepID=UPI000D654FD3|nr:flagellar hook-length control protein FliK [Dyella sp. C11]